MTTAKCPETGYRHPAPQPDDGTITLPREGSQGTWGLVGKTKGLQVGTLKFASDFASNLLCDLWQI